MRLISSPMSEEHALEILSWNYDKPYDFYNSDVSEETVSELLENEYYVVLDHQMDIVGFYCVGLAAQVPIGANSGAYPKGFIDFGLGLKPELTGKGNGRAFLTFILSEEKLKMNSLRLTVALWNKRAIRLYERFGFIKTNDFQRGSITFITMVKK